MILAAVVKSIKIYNNNNNNKTIFKSYTYNVVINYI